MSAVLKRCAVSVMAVAVLLVAGCTQPAQTPATTEPAAAAKPAGPPELVTGKTAFWPMYKGARNWSSDIMFLRLSAKDIPGFEIKDGKAPLWEASFGSNMLHQFEIDAFAITTVLPNIHKGASTGLRQPWTGVTREALPIDVENFKIDSDAAYTAAVADAADWIKKNPAKKITSFDLGNTYLYKTLVWRITWGDAKTGGYVVIVDANTGKVMKKL